MPATRLSSTASVSEPRRRRSSHLLQPTPTIKPGIYGLQSRPIAFAPNVTPGTFVEPDYLTSSVPSTAAVLFPPSEKPTQEPVRKRHPPGKRPSQGYIPRPPNAFMLFRADFVKQRHVPGSIETNHGSLSKIIGNCWRQLPLEEKRYWEQRAKEEKQQHKIRHPDYRFRPVHNRNKNKDGMKPPTNPSTSKKEKTQQTPEEEMRCDAVAALLLEGKKGDELAQAVRNLDMAHNARFASLSREGTVSARGSLGSLTTPPPPYFYPNQLSLQHASGLSLRRPSSVPLPDAWLGGFGPTMFSSQPQYPMPSMALPHVPFMTSSRPVSPSPVTGISFASQQQNHGLLLRRPSSAQPMSVGRRSWTNPSYEGYTVMPFLHDLGIEHQLRHLHPVQPQEQQPETAGEPDYALFNGFSFNTSQMANLSPIIAPPQDGSQNASNVGPHDLPSSSSALSLSMDHIGWNGEIDSALESASSLVSSSSTTVSSHESSPAPSENVRDMYATSSDNNTNGIFARPMYAIDANYDLGLTSFDIPSQLDHLSMTNNGGGFSHDDASTSYHSFDHPAGLMMMESAQTMMTMMMAEPILHAPKPLLANECTPTQSLSFEDQMGTREFMMH